MNNKPLLFFVFIFFCIPQKEALASTSSPLSTRLESLRSTHPKVFSKLQALFRESPHCDVVAEMKKQFSAREFRVIVKQLGFSRKSHKDMVIQVITDRFTEKEISVSPFFPYMDPCTELTALEEKIAIPVPQAIRVQMPMKGILIALEAEIIAYAAVLERVAAETTGS